jgi:hypothetical protein
MRSRTLASATVVLAAGAAVGVFARVSSPAHTAPAAPVGLCGSERWAVKTLTDPAQSKVAFSKTKAKTVEGLRHLKAPPDLKSSTPRLTGTERTVFHVTALLMSMRREDDSDIHLVIADPKLGGSMIAELPSASCTLGAPEKQRAAMDAARGDLAAACGGLAGVTPVTLSGTATLTGVGFFDPIHGHSGVAPNGIELHPVLSFASSNCKRVRLTLPRG